MSYSMVNNISKKGIEVVVVSVIYKYIGIVYIIYVIIIIIGIYEYKYI